MPPYVLALLRTIASRDSHTRAGHVAKVDGCRQRKPLSSHRMVRAGDPVPAHWHRSLWRGQQGSLSGMSHTLFCSSSVLMQAQGSLVVVKSLTSDDGGEEFARELDMLSKLSHHPNIVILIVRAVVAASDQQD